jgi:hypothetical protein
VRDKRITAVGPIRRCLSLSPGVRLTFPARVALIGKKNLPSLEMKQ